MLCASLVAVAETAAAQAATARDEASPTIVVTAQRRPELSEDVPIFVTALSGEQLERSLATDMAGLGKVVASLVTMRTGAFTQPYLRGVGKRSTLGVENSVATYVDGVYLASSISALLDLRGIERVEVLNGPQGTLFGRNATGGVIQIVTRDPTSDEAAEAEVHLGNYGHVRGDVYLNAGDDRVAGNLAMSLSRNDGYGTNLFTGKTDQGAVDHSFVIRGKSLWQASDSVRMTFAADYQDIDHDFTQLPVTGFVPLGAPRIQTFRDADQNAPSRYRFRYGGVSLKADLDVGGLTLMSLTAMRELRARYSTDLDQGPLPLLLGAPVAEQTQLSQELQLQSDPSAALTWVAGLYYIRLEEQYEPTLFLYGGSYSARLGGRLSQSLEALGKTSSYAAYGQATVPLGARTRLTAGLRYTFEDRSVEARGEQRFDNAPFVRPIPGLPLASEAPSRNSRDFDELTWRASLDHDLSDSLMGYVSASRGFQSGGWNLQTPQNPPFGPERLDAFEAGLKYVAPSGGFRADASAFYYNYSDLQVSAFTPIGSVTTNAASADILGLDVQFEAQADRRTALTFQGQVLDARFNRFPNATCTNYSQTAAVTYLPIICDVTGNRLPFAPRFKFNAGVARDVPLGRSGSLELSGNIAFNSGYFSEADNVVRQDSFATLDLSAQWRPVRKGPAVRLWVTNATGTGYYESLVTFPTTGVLQRPGPPRRVGLSLEFAI